MLKSKANWIWNNKKSAESSSLIESLLEERGIVSEEEKERFLYPKLEYLQDPSSFHQIEKAKERIFTAIENEEKIVVYGDYDADGVTSTTLLMKTLMELDAICDFYIPNRFTEGYGLHKDAIEKIYNEGATVIITVDTGISNVIEADYIKQLGIDLIITDHHEVQEQLPDAYAIIHPKLSPDYKFKELAGVGVAFQFAYHLLDYLPVHLLDLVAIGTIADLVPLLGENRILATYGLKQLANSTNVGMKAMKEICNLTEEPINERHVGFMLAPRLNAVGRLKDANLAVKLLLTEDEIEAREYAKQMEELNAKRQQIVNDIVKEAEKRVNDNDGIIILYDEKWHEGVLGIAASRLVRQYDRPVIMLTYKKETNELKGSARSISKFDIFQNCLLIKDLFTAFGGHSQAAGMTFPFEHLPEIKSFLNERVFEQLSSEDFKQEITISQKVKIEHLTEQLVETISQFAPFGMKNEEPIFHVEAIPSQIRQIGQENNHLKMQFKCDNQVVDAIGFQMGHLFYFLSDRAKVSIVGKLQMNEWNGIRTVQMMLEDIAVNEWQLFDYRGKQQDKNLLPYMSFYKENLVVVNSNDQLDQFNHLEHVQVITYESDVSTLEKAEILYIYDLPYDLTVLQNIVKQVNPSCIHISYTVTEDAFLQTVPNRTEFKWLYGFIFKHSPIHLKVDIPKIMQMKQWTKEKIIFMLKVFLDLQFIMIENDVIYINKDVQKTELQNSRTYQYRLQQSEIEKTLYYSTYQELKQWFENYLVIGETNREEVLHEL